MSAIVTILNKSAVAVAADSALTHVCNNGKEKVWNTTRKVFQLIPGQPIGISTTGYAEFMEVPMDLIIGLYGKQSEGKSFGTVREYAQDFMDWLQNCTFLKSVEQQEDAFRFHMKNLFNEVEQTVKSRMEEHEEEATDELHNNIFMEYLHELIDIHKDAIRCANFEDYTLKQFKKELKQEFDNFQKKVLEREGLTDEKIRPLFERFVYTFLLSENFIGGIEVHFFGYGDDEIFPVDIKAEIHSFIDNRLLYYISKDADTGEDGACLIPQGQTDIIRTFAWGISPAMMRTVRKLLKCALSAYQAAVFNCLDEIEVHCSLLEELDRDEFCQEAMDHLNKKIDENASDNFLDVVESYSPESLAQTAEDMVSVAELASRTSGDTESVQGPIDVAVITKVDGFVWKKRK